MKTFIGYLTFPLLLSIVPQKQSVPEKLKSIKPDINRQPICMVKKIL